LIEHPFVHIAKPETLEEACRNAKRNRGAPGIDVVLDVGRLGRFERVLLCRTAQGRQITPRAGRRQGERSSRVPSLLVAKSAP
jgi:hypothetical protein